MVATAGTPAGREAALGLGADLVVDHRDPGWPAELSRFLQGATMDVVFDGVGGEASGRLLRLLTPGAGRTLLYGAASGAPPALDATPVMSLGLRVIGVGGPVWAERVFGVHYPEFLRLAAQGRSHLLPVDATLPLARAAEAHRRIEEGARRIVLLPGG